MHRLREMIAGPALNESFNTSRIPKRNIAPSLYLLIKKKSITRGIETRINCNRVAESTQQAPLSLELFLAVDVIKPRMQVYASLRV